MKSSEKKIKSVAIIGAGPSGAITAAALKAENYFERIRVFERRETAGGTWIHDTDPGPAPPVEPGKLPNDIDPHLDIPKSLPVSTAPDRRNRWATTPVYDSLSTNIPNSVMTFSDALLPYGPFAPHYIARQYVENYFAIHQTDSFLQTNTTVEDLTHSPATDDEERSEWRVTLRKYDAARQIDLWWEESFDAVVLANGHYAVPYVPQVKGLERYMEKYPGHVSHSKRYRTPEMYAGQRVLIIGNSVSGKELSDELVGVAKHPVYISRRTPARWEGEEPPLGIEWKPIVTEYREDGAVLFSNGTRLDDIDAIIYCTGYKPSFPFWNEAANGGPLFDYRANRLRGSYQHVFFRDFPTLGTVGFPRTITFRSFEYQAIALARLWSGRNALPLPSPRQQAQWEADRDRRVRVQHQYFHDVKWGVETMDYLGELFAFAGLPTLRGDGLLPPPFTKQMIWEYEHVLKWKIPIKQPALQAGGGHETPADCSAQRGDIGRLDSTVQTADIVSQTDWVVVDRYGPVARA